MLSANLLLLVVLAAELGGGRDAGPGRDALSPAWLPTPVTAKPVHLSEQALYDLRRSGDGYVYDTPNFEARVARDGVVTFKDRKIGFGGLGLPWKPLPYPSGPTLESTLRDHFDKRRRAPPPPAAEPPPLPNTIDWNAVCSRGSACNVQPDPTLVQVQGKLDLTDELMRAHGQDPYAWQKARFLSATFDFRTKLATEARKEDMKSSLIELPEQLEALWADRRYSPRERRRILYELWLETDQTPQGEKAAGMIGLFIRRRLPCSSPDAYTADELAAFDRAHPGRHFAPGDCPSRPPAK